MGVVWLLAALNGWNQPCCTNWQTRSESHSCARVCHSPHHTIWHTDWLISWWACLWHTDCARLQQETQPSFPFLLTHLLAPPCIHAVFSREAPTLLLHTAATSPVSSSQELKEWAITEEWREDVWLHREETWPCCFFFLRKPQDIHDPSFPFDSGYSYWIYWMVTCGIFLTIIIKLK